MSWVPPGFGPFESYEADHTVAGGERLSLAGLDIEVVFTPGHSPGHVDRDRAVAERGGAAVGDVLFQGSVGRVDLPGGDWATLERSIGGLLRAFPARRWSTRAHGRDDARARARHEPVPRRAARARARAAATADAPAAGS